MRLRSYMSPEFICWNMSEGLLCKVADKRNGWAFCVHLCFAENTGNFCKLSKLLMRWCDTEHGSGLCIPLYKAFRRSSICSRFLFLTCCLLQLTKVMWHTGGCLFGNKKIQHPFSSFSTVVLSAYLAFGFHYFEGWKGKENKVIKHACCCPLAF